MPNQFPNVNSTYGAPTGRPSYGQPITKCRLFRVRLNSGGYDDGGAYWGIGAPLYCATDDADFYLFARARDRKAAAEHFERKHPGIAWRRAPYAAIRGSRWSSSSGRIELRIPMADAKGCSHPGPCDADVDELRSQSDIARQLDAIDKDTLAAELKGYGAWDAAELADHGANLDRLLWIACCDLAEGLR